MTSTPSSTPSLLERLSMLAQIFGAVGIPIALVVLTSIFQDRQNSQNLNAQKTQNENNIKAQKNLIDIQTQQKYIELAISILSKPKDDKATETGPLRNWAAKILKTYSPKEAMLTDDLIKVLVEGKFDFAYGYKLGNPSWLISKADLAEFAKIQSFPIVPIK